MAYQSAKDYFGEDIEPVQDAKSYFGEEPIKQPEKGYLTRLMNDWQNRGSEISKDYNAPMTSPMFLDRMLRIGGNVAGAIGDPLVEATTSAYRTLVPQSVQDTISSAKSEVANNPLYKPFLEGVSKTASEHPEALKNVEAVANLATLPGVTSTYKALYDTGKKAVASVTNPLRMYTSAVKPGTNRKGLAAVQDEMQYALDKGLMPSAKGLDVVNDAIASNRAQTLDAIAQHPNTVISTGEDALQHIPALIDEWAGAKGKAVYPAESKKIIQDATIKFWNEHGSTMSLEKADAVKRQLYANERNYNTIGRPTPPTEIMEFEKTVARGLKDSLYDSVMDTHPELRLLGEDSKLMIDLRKTFDAAAQRIGRRDIMGIGLPIKTGVGTAIGKVTGLPGLGTVVGVAAGIMDTPTVKAKLAIALNKAKQKSLADSLNRAALEKMGARVVSQKMMEDNNE